MISSMGSQDLMKIMQQQMSSLGTTTSSGLTFGGVTGTAATSAAGAAKGGVLDITSSGLSVDSTSACAGLAQMASDALKASGAKEGESSETGKMLNSARTSYFKQHFPNMTDEQIATLNKFYDAQYTQYEEQMSSFMTDLCKSMGIDPNAASKGVATASNGNYYGPNSGVDGLMADANSMVGMTESGDTAAINKITQQSGINCATTPWCAAWAMNMLKNHGVLDTSSCSNVNYCPTIRNWAKDQGIWANRGAYTPQSGDAILFDWDQDGTADHIGIVSGVSNGQVNTIEGNSSNSVAKRSYSLNSSSVMGYVNCAAQK